MSGLGTLDARPRYPKRCFICISGADKLIEDALKDTLKASKTKRERSHRPSIYTIWRALQEYDGDEFETKMLPAHPNSLANHLAKHEPLWSHDNWDLVAK